MEKVYLTVIITIIIAAIAVFLWDFFQRPDKEQREKVIEWLKFVVTKMEKEYGSGTGQLKLRGAYDLFLSTFPDIANYISFKTFSSWVDLALIWLNTQLDNNKNIKELMDNGK